ncbi:glycosyl hydrolase [Coprobacter tertius]|uniref:Glycoside hydrolase family 2 n=1 Tax=Coprobacter tertius TaxID=2944915 RepID=A0ABT1MGP4_9BACT|nr:glycosyl hydrolase [Coprobacter tertius]MCP9611800.1 glycoside hydrolase family 2 [Coprobacter tertius]
MKKTSKLKTFVFIASVLFSCTLSFGNSSDKKLRSGFVIPPDSIKTSVYWYWISGNVSEEGVIKDLESMKKAGINRAYIGNIGLTPSEAPVGKVKLFSDEWWKITHAALKKATQLSIEIGMFNCPGWSQAGGPWITPDKSMRYLSSTKVRVTGGKKITIDLQKPGKDFQDVKVLAYPYPLSSDSVISIKNSEIISSSGQMENIAALIDEDRKTELIFPKDKSFSVDIRAPKNITVRSCGIYTSHRTRVKVTLQAWENNRYLTLKEFWVDRTNAELCVGFEPYAPVIVTLPETNSDKYRFIFSQIDGGSGISEIELSACPLIERYAEKSLAKMFQSPLPYWHEYMWERQGEPNSTSGIIDPKMILDITDCLNGNELTWTAPSGEWQIVRYGMLPTRVENSPAAPEGTGLEVDKMSSAYLQHHFDSFLGKIMQKIPAEDRKSLKVSVSDSYEKGGQNYTDTFIEDFIKRYGYDPLPFFPVFEGMVVESRDISDRFLWDLRRMVADNLAYEHIGAMKKIAHKYGLKLWLENYGHWGFPGEFLQYGGQSDEVSGEFWSEGSLGDIENRAASSCAHIYGKPQVSAESFTCAGSPFARYPSVIKPRGDRFFAEGINNTLLHVYISQPDDTALPGLNAWFGTEFNRNNTWFSQIDLFINYLKRSNYMLQLGVNVADVAYFIGEDAPKMTGVADPVLPEGYQFDYINSEVILNRLTVKDGLLTLPHGVSYRILVLPKQETMRPELLEKLRQLVYDGAVILGPQPKRSPSLQNYPEADMKIQQIGEELWNGISEEKRYKKVGKGMVMCGMEMTEALEVIGCVPDCKITSGIPVNYCHRTLGNTDIYFLTNQSNNAVEFDASFRNVGKQPELWDAVSGTMRILPSFNRSERTTLVPLKLAPYESTFIVFNKRQHKKNSLSDGNANFPKPKIIAEMNSPWKLSFEKGRRAPSDIIEYRALEDLSLSANDSIRYFSGTVTYTSAFNIDAVPRNGRTYIDLGDVAVMAKIWINDRYVGGVWTTPYRIDISEYLHKGENQVKIEVVNTWVNRLIGDSGLPENERETYCPVNTWKPDSKLQKSGLIGPVVIENFDYIRIK